MMVNKGEKRVEVQVTRPKQRDFTACEDDKLLACTWAMRRTNSTLYYQRSCKNGF